MITSQTFRNKAIVVGRLGNVLNRKRKETLLDPYRTPIGGQEYRAAVQLITTEGEPYTLGLDVHPGIPGYDLFHGADATTCLAFEGAVRLFTRYDSRYAEGDDDAGRRVTEMRLDVRLIRAPRDDEPDGATAVWLEGTVLEPPRFARHYEQTSLQVGIAKIQVLLDQASDERPAYPGLRRASLAALEVQVAVRTSDERAGLLYRPGNQVRIDGELSRWMLPQYGDVVQSTIAKRHAEHQATVAKAANREEQSAIVRQYRREVQNLALQARTLVMVAYVEAMDEKSTPISFAEAQELRQDFVKQLRRRKARQQRPAVQRSTAPQIADADTADAATPSDSPTEAEAAASAMPLPRPRRKAVAPIPVGEEQAAPITHADDLVIAPTAPAPVGEKPSAPIVQADDLAITPETAVGVVAATV